METIGIIIGLVTALCTSGGVVYLLIEKHYSRKKDDADAVTTEVSNGNDVADLYNKIDEIVERKTAPIRNELVTVKGQLEDLKSTWCCYREDCSQRILYRRKSNSDENV